MTEVLNTGSTEVFESNMHDHAQNGSVLLHISNISNRQTSSELEGADWAKSANCEGVNPDLFYPEYGADTDQAKGVCQSCVVRGECQRFAVDNNIDTGIWGGLDAAERQSLTSV